MAKKVGLILKDLVWPAVVAIALVAFYGFLFLIVGLKNFVQLIGGLVWPTVVVIALVILRKPLSYFLSGIAQHLHAFYAQKLKEGLSPTMVTSLHNRQTQHRAPGIKRGNFLRFAVNRVAGFYTSRTEAALGAGRRRWDSNPRRLFTL